MKKFLTPAQVEFIHLNANDTICTSFGIDNDEFNDEDLIGAPTRYNYRGVAIDYEEDEF